jgi:hypothetical protein
MNKNLFIKIVQGVREYADYFKYKKIALESGVHVGSKMHGCPTVHCIWSSAKFNSGLSTHVRDDIYR